MRGCTFLIAVCALLIIEVHAQYDEVEEDCPYNELDVECVNRCNTCEYANNQTCPTTDDCEMGCDCKPGFLRNKFGYCIPQRYCGASELPVPTKEPSTQGSREVANSEGCPSAQLCNFSCKRRGFATGICLGPGPGNCNCYTSTQVPTEDGNREVADSSGCPSAQLCVLSCKRRGFATGLCLGPGLFNCNCYTATQVPAEQETPGNREIADSSGCPSAQLCVLSCKRRGFTTGLCLGPGPGNCNCYTATQVPAGQGSSGNREVADSSGCPSAQLCVLSCKRRGFTTGLCLGPRQFNCNCYTSTQVPAGTGNREVAESGGCPSTLNCMLSCKRRNFETGVCLGPQRRYCNCYSSSSSRTHGCPQRSLCEASCKRRRYATGICIGPRRLNCRCSGKLD